MTVNLEISNRPKANGCFTLFFRITHKRKSKRIDSGFEIDQKYWRKRSGQKRYYLAKSTPNYVQISNKKLSLETALTGLVETNPLLSIDGLLDNYNNQSSKTVSEIGFFVYACRLINKIRLEGRTGYARNLLNCVRNFADFCFSKEHNASEFIDEKLEQDIPFNSLSLKVLNDFEHWLQVKKLKTNTIHNNLKSLRSIYYKAEFEEVFKVESNPFKKKKLKIARTKKKAIGLDDIKKLESLKLNNEKLQVALDMFMFSFYCAGLRWGDVSTIKEESLNNGVLTLVPRKTRNTNQIGLTIKLDDKALAILKKYTSRESKSFIFPILNPCDSEAELLLEIGKKNALVNKRLKTIAALAKIKVPISFHMSRHSYATLALKKNIPLAAISQLLCHSDLKTTQIYLKELDQEELSEAHMSILDY